jgi:hypothetical protein
MSVQPVQDVEAGQSGQPVDSARPSPPGGAAEPGAVAVSSPDGSGDLLRERLEAARCRAQNASSWAQSTRHLARLLNREGVVPVTARLGADDLCFLETAREELLALAAAGLQLADLHQPLDDTGTGCDAAGAGPRCKNCMWRWPCPTFRILSQILGPGRR